MHKPRDNEARILVGGFDTLVTTRANMAQIMVADCYVARRDRDGVLPKLVFSSNGQGIALAGSNTDFAKAMEQADIIHADGMSVVFASRMTRQPLPERVVTTDFFHDAAKAAEKAGLSFFMLGATDAQNLAAIEAISRLYPDLKIAGRHHGYFKADQDEEICAMVRDSGADVLWVALGKPRQEFWSVANRHRLAGVGWIKTCGGLYSYLAGDAPRAPLWMQNLSLEWLYRMMDDPKRLVWRYLTTNPYSFYRLVRYTDRSR